MKNRQVIYLLAMVLVAAFAFAYLMIFIIAESAQCTQNPFVYGAEVAYEQGTELVCSCSSIDGKNINFRYDKDELTPIIPRYSSDYDENSLDFSNIEVTGGN